VGQRGNGPAFPLEARDTARILRPSARKNLDGDVPTQAGVSCKIDFPHTSLTDERDNLVRSKLGPAPERSELRVGASRRPSYGLALARVGSVVFVRHGAHFAG